MKSVAPTLAVLALATPALAEETRQLDAHVHGVGELNIAIEGETVAMELHVPGADIVGFEHAAESEEDQAKVAAALETLTSPLALFALPEAAGCAVTEAAAELEIEGAEDHDDHGHDDHDHDDHGHEDHAEDEHDEDGHDEDGHDDHGHEDHAEEAHDHDDEHDHDDHAEEAGATHSEFHGEYVLTCAAPTEITQITFAYFDSFPNAEEVDVQIVTEAGAQAFEVPRDAPVLDLSGLF